MFKTFRLLCVLGAFVAVVAVAGTGARAQQAAAPPGSSSGSGLKDAAACIVICSSGRGGTISSPQEKQLYQQCVRERHCTSEGPTRPVAREPPEKLLNRPLDILKGIPQGGRV